MLKGSLLAKSRQKHQSHVPPSHQKQPIQGTVPAQPRIPQVEEAAKFMVAGTSQNSAARAATPKAEPNAPEVDVSRRRHSPSRCSACAKQSVDQSAQELAHARSVYCDPILPDRHVQEIRSCSQKSRPPEEEAFDREAPGPIVRSNTSNKSIPSTSAHGDIRISASNGTQVVRPNGGNSGPRGKGSTTHWRPVREGEPLRRSLHPSHAAPGEGGTPSCRKVLERSSRSTRRSRSHNRTRTHLQSRISNYSEGGARYLSQRSYKSSRRRRRSPPRHTKRRWQAGKCTRKFRSFR